MHPATDHLLNFVSIVSGSVTTFAVIGGAIVGYRYSRKANTEITANAYVSDSAFLLAARPTVTAVGPVRLKFKKENGAKITVTPLLRTDGKFIDGEPRTQLDVFNDQWVNAGESLSTTTIFPYNHLAANVVGWRVALRVEAKGFFRHGLHWGDTIFVQVPSGGGTMSDQESTSDIGKAQHREVVDTNESFVNQDNDPPPPPPVQSDQDSQ